ncbi:MAG: late competence development ComFB family protein [Lachnospiraceae bacterium]|nr:late competence development ComFB family protein [Lachnospiraceae bacterium]
MQIILRNIMEDYVIITLDHMLDSLDCCKCEKCRLDMASYALNRLPSKYVATTQGELMTKLCEFDNQFETRVMAELAAAAEVIKSKPRHDEIK